MTALAPDAPDGLQQLSAMIAGGVRAPIGEKLGFNLVEAERGRVVLEATPDPSAYNPFGTVHTQLPANKGQRRWS